MTRIGILGSRGRMGQAIAAAITDGGAVLAGAIDVGGDAVALARSCDVLVDFTVPGALVASLAAARDGGAAIVVGTTGLSPGDHAGIDAAARDVAVLQAANTSLGINLLAALVAQATARLGDGWDVEIVEMHHRHKRDAPSGTALLLGEAAARGRGKPLDPLKSIDRDGLRDTGAVGFASLRGGSVAGDHMVVLAGDGERLEFGHRAESRDIFARGAVRAANWLAGKPPGRYTMSDVLELRGPTP